MELRVLGPDDQWLTEAMECDPRVMKDLGGPQPREKIPGIHARRLSYVAGGAWYFTIVPDAKTGPVGTVCMWDTEWKGEKIGEMGWMMLPRFQGRGLMSAAVRLVVDRARAEKRFPSANAFPATGNGASNAICRKAGFRLVGEADLEYDGRPLHCCHWRLDF